MAEHARCLRCRHANPPENHFCGWCGAALDGSRELVPRREDAFTAARRTLPAKLGPAGKVVAVGLVTLAAEVGLSWLRHRTRAEERPVTLTGRQVDSAAPERLLGESLEEVLIQELEEGHRSRVFVRRAIRSLVITRPLDRELPITHRVSSISTAETQCGRKDHQGNLAGR
jgi:hypothetical protein